MSSEYATISTETDRIEVENAAKEAAASLIRIDAERDLIKDIATRMKEEFAIAPGDFKRIVNMYHRQNLDEQQEKHNKVVDLYNQVFASKKVVKP